ncbi:MAG: DUF72 domain-containing protein [bacterium]
MAKIFIGTSGYSYKDWIGPVYPEGTKQADFLKIYAEQFDVVELNFSYYRQPEAGLMEKLLRMTGDDFKFSIKAYKGLTHEITHDPSLETSRFKEGIAPLIEASQLGAVLLQFPYSFHYTRESRKYLQNLCAQLQGVPLSIEFRNNEWLKDSVYKTLREYNIAIVSVDEPDLPKLLKPSDRTTATFSYIRFHGRNKKMWWHGDNTTRYDYLYTEQELEAWIPRIQCMAARTTTLFIFFNNHRNGQAVINARQLQELLKIAT